MSEKSPVVENKGAILPSAELVLANLRLATLIENLHGGVLVEDSKRKILCVNKSFCETFQIPSHPSQMIGWDCSEAAEQSKHFFRTPFEFVNRVADLLARREKVIDEILEMADGRILERDYIPIFLEESYEGHMWVYRDITEKIRKENLFKQHQASLVASANLASLGEMASGIAHEINNPLAIIRGKASILKILIEKQDIDLSKFTVALTSIEKTCDRISKIIRALRSLSRNVENDPMRNVKVETIIEGIFELCRERLNLNCIDARVQVPSDILVECRETQIGQVIMNLINNALDAVVNLDEKWVQVDVVSNGQTVQISVTDSGKGIAPEIASKIMQPFFTTKEADKGTGLGLSISRSIALDHHGKLTYDSESKNTRFVLELPISQPQ